MHRGIIAICALLVITPITALAQKAPPQAEWDKASADITGTDTQLQTAALEKIKGWVKGTNGAGWVSADVWRKWLPALVKANRHQDAYDLATLALAGRPNADAASILQEARYRAAVAVGKNELALQMAKAYYNVCDIKATATGVDFVGTALAKARPEDLEIVRKFRAEQAAASVVAAASGAGVPAGGAGTAPAMASAPEPILKSVTIDAGPFEAALKVWNAKTKFADRVAYGNLLLVSDQGAAAEKLFRELYALAATAEELTVATEGIARALRAEDGNVARANVWLTKIAQSAPPGP